MVFLAVACFAAAELASHALVASGGAAYPIFWIPLGFLTAGLITSETKRWPGLIAAAAAGILISGIAVHGHAWREDALACAITLLEATTVAVLVRHYNDGPFELTRVTHVWNLALVSSIVAAAGGLLQAALLEGASAGGLLLAWRGHGMGDVDGLLLGTPVGVGVIQGPGLFTRSAPSTRRAETLVVLVLAVTVTEMVFGDLAPSAVRAPAYILPMLLWVGFRCEAGDAALALFVICIVGVWNTAEGRGPFTLAGPDASLGAWLLRAQGAAVTTSLSIMLLAAVVAERRRAAAERDQLVVELQNALAQIKTLHGLIPLCAWCHKIRDDAGAWQGLETYLQQHTDATFSHGICPSCNLTIDAEHFAEAEARARNASS
jgi:integral membrane sensor domain MASE1